MPSDALRLMCHAWPAAAAERANLLHAIDHQRAAYPTGRLNVGGRWAGPKNPFDDPRTHPLRDWIRSVLPDDCIVDAWGLVLERGDTIRPHRHRKSHRDATNIWAGAYFVSVPPAAGRLLVDNMLEAIPTDGYLLAFPADVLHGVSTHEVDTLRISIGFSALPTSTPGSVS